MKKLIGLMILMLLLCAGSVTAIADEAPQTAKDYFADRIEQGYTITRWFTATDSSYAYAVLSKDGHNRIFVLKKNADSFDIEVSSSKAIYQGDFLPELYSESDGTFYLTYTIADGQNQVYHYRRGTNGSWNLQAYETVNEDGKACYFATFQSDMMEYFVPQDDGLGYGTKIYGMYQRALRYVSINALPHTLKQARDMLSNPPKIPQGDFDAINIRFTGGQKYAVYAAPDETALRGAGGKATVSTNDWIQVFGQEDGWVLIQYDISAAKMRFGYITASALPQNASVSPLAFVPQEIEIVRQTAVTDDPLNSQEKITSLQQGQANCYFLASLNEEWAYIQAETTQGQVYRGFVNKTAFVLARQRVDILNDTTLLTAESESPEINRYAIDNVPVTSLANVGDVYELEEGGFILAGGSYSKKCWILTSDERAHIVSESFVEDIPQKAPYLKTAGMVNGKLMAGFRDYASNKGCIGIYNDRDKTYTYTKLNEYSYSMDITKEGILVCGGRPTGEYTSTFWGALIGSNGQILWEYCPKYETGENNTISGLYCDATYDHYYLFATQPIDGSLRNKNGHLTRLDPDGTVIWEKVFQLPEDTHISGMCSNSSYVLLYGRNELSLHGQILLYDTDGYLQQQIEVNKLFAVDRAILTDTGFIVSGRDGTVSDTTDLNKQLWKFLTYDFDGDLHTILPVHFTEDVYISVMRFDKDNNLWVFGKIDEDVLMMRFH